MIKACKQYIIDRFSELKLSDSSAPYKEENIFFYEMERDFLKEHEYAVLTFFPQDRKKPDGSVFKKDKDLDALTITYTRKIFKRTILARLLIYALEELESLCEDLEQSIAGNRNIADSDNNLIKVSLQDLIRPWDTERKDNRLRRRSPSAIARIEFEGGIYSGKTVPLIPGLANISINNE